VYLRAMSSLLRDIEAIAASADEAILANADLLPNGPRELQLIGVRRDADHLFLRYELSRR